MNLFYEKCPVCQLELSFRKSKITTLRGNIAWVADHPESTMCAHDGNVMVGNPAKHIPGTRA